jgi:hypothetical protein
VRTADQVRLFIAHVAAYVVVSSALQVALGGASWLWWGIGLASHAGYVLLGGRFVDWQAARARGTRPAADAR